MKRQNCCIAFVIFLLLLALILPFWELLITPAVWVPEVDVPFKHLLPWRPQTPGQEPPLAARRAATRGRWPDAHVSLSCEFFLHHAHRAPVLSSNHSATTVLGMGMMNQHMTLITLLTLAIALGVDEVSVPPAASRDSFHGQQMRWRPEEPDTLWDLTSIRALLAPHNISLVVQSSRESHVKEAALVRLPSLEWQFKRLEDIVTMAHETVHEGLAQMAEINRTPSTVPLAIHLRTNDLLGAVNTQGLMAYTRVAVAIEFNREVAALADIIVQRLRNVSSTQRFNGLHLRMEQDWTDFKKFSERTWELNKCQEAMQELQFTGDAPLYVASGIFIDNDTQVGAIHTTCASCSAWLHRLVEVDHVARSIHSHSNVLSNVSNGTDSDALARIQRLHSEQVALLDFLVLMHADKVVGWFQSSFSCYLREYRAMRNISRDTFEFHVNMDRGVVVHIMRHQWFKESWLADMVGRQQNWCTHGATLGSELGVAEGHLTSSNQSV